MYKAKFPYGALPSMIPPEHRRVDLEKVVAACDVLDALLSKRPYKKIRSLETTVRILRQELPHVDRRILDTIDDLLGMPHPA
jgi:hypothetical protein